MIYPWQQTQWQHLMQVKAANCLSHAYLFIGMAGIGKAFFAEQLTRALLCQQDNCQETNHCHACCLIEGRVHPNVRWIVPEKSGQAIKIDQIRDINEFIQHSAWQGVYRIVMIDPAHHMTMQAANALLKTLEEPTANAIIILVTDQRERLPATIISRCQRILFQTPELTMATEWLRPAITQYPDRSPELLLSITQGAPLAALRLLESNTIEERQQLFTALYRVARQEISPLAAATLCQDFHPVQNIDLTMGWLLDVIQLIWDNPKIRNQDWQSQLMTIKNQTSWLSCEKWLGTLQTLRGQLISGIHLNKQLLMEMLFLQWREIIHDSAR